LYQQSAGNFVNSSEIAWELEKYEVMIQCNEQTRLLVWPRSFIKDLNDSDPQLAGLLNGVLSRDVANKLRAVEDTIAQEHYRLHHAVGKTTEEPVRRSNTTIFHRTVGKIQKIRRKTTAISRPVSRPNEEIVAQEEIELELSKSHDDYDENTNLLDNKEKKS